MSLTSSLSSFFRTGLPRLQKHFTLLSHCSKNAYHGIISGKSALLPERKASDGLLVTKILSMLPDRGLKYMGRVRKRCKDCYFVVRDERLYVMCKTHPRHKQAALQKKEKYRWILTHATQSKIRPW